MSVFWVKVRFSGVTTVNVVSMLSSCRNSVSKVMQKSGAESCACNGINLALIRV